MGSDMHGTFEITVWAGNDVDDIIKQFLTIITDRAGDIKMEFGAVSEPDRFISFDYNIGYDVDYNYDVDKMIDHAKEYLEQILWRLIKRLPGNIFTDEDGPFSLWGSDYSVTVHVKQGSVYAN